MEKISYTIKEAVEASGLSRSEIYRRLSENGGALKAIKNRRQTLIVAESLRALISSFPSATFRAPRVAA